jgi:hypothetical protein
VDQIIGTRHHASDRDAWEATKEATLKPTFFRAYQTISIFCSDHDGCGNLNQHSAGRFSGMGCRKTIAVGYMCPIRRSRGTRFVRCAAKKGRRGRPLSITRKLRRLQTSSTVHAPEWKAICRNSPHSLARRWRSGSSTECRCRLSELDRAGLGFPVAAHAWLVMNCPPRHTRTHGGAEDQPSAVRRARRCGT